MAQLQHILDQVASGVLSVEDAAPLVAGLVSGSARPLARDWLERSGGDQEFAASFGAVEAARLAGRISTDQYAVLRRAVVDGGG